MVPLHLGVGPRLLGPRDYWPPPGRPTRINKLRTASTPWPLKLQIFEHTSTAPILQHRYYISGRSGAWNYVNRAPAPSPLAWEHTNITIAKSAAALTKRGAHAHHTHHLSPHPNTTRSMNPHTLNKQDYHDLPHCPTSGGAGVDTPWNSTATLEGHNSPPAGTKKLGRQTGGATCTIAHPHKTHPTSHTSETLAAAETFLPLLY